MPSNIFSSARRIMHSHKGIFIAVDGIDGSGKTTLCGELFAILAPFDPIIRKEPTSDSEWGRKLRAAASSGRLPSAVELDYFHRDRLHHIENFILPHLRDGKAVICDRYVDSTLAFQADTPDQADVLYERMKNEILTPDLTFILRCPVEVGLERIQRNRPEKSQYETVETLSKAAAIYESRENSHYRHLDASSTPANTLREAVECLKERFPDLSTVFDAHLSRICPIS